MVLSQGLHFYGYFYTKKYEYRLIIKDIFKKVVLLRVHFILLDDSLFTNICAASNKGFIKIYPDMEILLTISYCIASTNCTMERSFSVLKILKNYLRNLMAEEILNHLVISVINLDITSRLNRITEFSVAKSRKKKSIFLPVVYI